MTTKNDISDSDNSPPSDADFKQIDKTGDVFRQIFKYSVIPTIIHDMKMNIIDANDSAIQQFGYSRKELLGKSIFDLHTEEELDHSEEVLTEMQSKTKLSAETSFVRKDGSIFMAEVTPCKYLVGDEPIVHVFIQDITERKHFEKELKESNQRLRAKNKEIEQFVYIASHDLQEPLRTIKGMGELLIDRYKGEIDSEADQALQYLVDSSTHLSNMVKELLEYNRIGKNQELVEVNCNELISQVKKDLALIIEETNTTFEIGNLPEIRGYKSALRLLFQNLISNAIKYRKENTSPHIIIEATKRKEDWLFSVKDQGIGIEEKDKDKIFIIFQRLHTKGKYEGTGIGLAHCRKIVNMHGGDIWVESQPNVGSTFYFTIAT